jgi:hypothetical protein
VHPSRSDLARFLGHEAPASDAEAIRLHVASCQECAHVMRTVEGFVADLDDAWARKRLNEVAAEMHWPTREDLVDYFLEDLPSEGDRQAIQAHVQSCGSCQEILADLRQGSADVRQADPLGALRPAEGAARSGWREALRELLRPAAWPAWSLAVSAAAAVFLLGFLLRPLIWPSSQEPRGRLMAQVDKPKLQRQEDGGIVLGIGATTAKPEARALLMQALAFYDAPDFAERALPPLEQAVTADPTFEQARFWLGVCFLLKGDTSKAVPQLEEAARLAPGNVTYHHYLVWGYLKAGEFGKALQAQTWLLNRPARK